MTRPCCSSCCGRGWSVSIACLVQRVGERHPSQQSTLHARWVLADAGERDAVTDDVLVTGVRALGGEHGAHRLVGGHRLGDGVPDDLVGQDAGRGRRDRAAEGVVGDVADHGVGAGALDLHPQGDLVAAGGVDVVHLGAERLAQPGVVRVAWSARG